ncbi:MAG TPA: NUDIX hydrolase [Trebonia sp.]|jgi:ADP-ribose pyrophosphatase|nr:NUDIX hydrolase [Trebonia sp.]
MVEDLPPDGWPVAGTEEHFRNWLVSVRTDKVVMPDGQQAARTVITHIGAVAVLALDERDRVLMIRQYRHPVARQLWEIPAGLRDVTGEALVDTARRELLEETGHVAREWHVLLDSYSSPGIITERMRIFLARGLEAADSGYQRQGEEKFLRTAWVPLAEAAAAALAGKLHNGAAIQGVLAGYIASSGGFSGLRGADAAEG